MVKSLLAQKGIFHVLRLSAYSEIFKGTTAIAGFFEARLEAGIFGGETHVYSPAYKAEDFEQLLQYADDCI